VVVEAEIVEQLRRRRLHPHHRPAPPQINTRMESRQPMPINGRLNQQYRRKAANRLSQRTQVPGYVAEFPDHGRVAEVAGRGIS
jgi:hypothetical protein